MTELGIPDTIRRVADLLRFVSRSIVHIPGWHGFAAHLRFDILGSCSDAEVLGALIDAPQFVGPGYEERTPTPDQLQERAELIRRLDKAALAKGAKVRIVPMDRRPRHGPFFVSDVRASSYGVTTSGHARAVMDRWAREAQDPTSEVSAHLEREIYRALDAPRIYSLVELGEGTEWPGAYGLWAYCEFVAIDHDQRRLSLIMAAYD